MSCSRQGCENPKCNVCFVADKSAFETDFGRKDRELGDFGLVEVRARTSSPTLPFTPTSPTNASSTFLSHCKGPRLHWISHSRVSTVFDHTILRLRCALHPHYFSDPGYACITHEPVPTLTFVSTAHCILLSLYHRMLRGLVLSFFCAFSLIRSTSGQSDYTPLPRCVVLAL